MEKYFDPSFDYFYYVLGAVLLAVYMLVTRLSARRNKLSELEIGSEEYREKQEKAIRRKTILLLILVAVGLYLVIFHRK